MKSYPFYASEQAELVRLCNILAPLAHRHDLQKRLLHRAKNGGECHRMFIVLVDEALGSGELTADVKATCGVMAGVLAELSPSYDEKRDGPRLWTWKRPVDFAQALASARGEVIYGESDDQREARERGEMESAIGPYMFNK